MSPHRRPSNKTTGLPGVRRAAKAIAEHFLGEEGPNNLDVVAEMERLIEEHARPSDLAGVVQSLDQVCRPTLQRDRRTLPICLEVSSLLGDVTRAPEPAIDSFGEPEVPV